MSEALQAQPRRLGGAGELSVRQGGEPCYGAIDLGTNNCRLLIATPSPSGFRVVEAFSRIVRLGEGLGQTGALSEAAMQRAIGALSICAEKVRRRRCIKLAAVATQACRAAANGEAFLQQVADRTGLKLEIITPRAEAQLSVASCVNLLDRNSEAALVLDVGGGSTELSLVDMRGKGLDANPRAFAAWELPIRAWMSAPVGVVTLAERFPEPDGGGEAWFRAMVDHVRGHIEGFSAAEPIHDLFSQGRGHMVGTSGAITSLAGLHLGLSRYDRNLIDGLWLSRDQCQAAAGRLLAMTQTQRAAESCIGPDRADLVLAGAAILQAVQELWPCERVRVADRGLREGLLMSLMSERRKRRRPRRRRGGRSPAVGT